MDDLLSQPIAVIADVHGNSDALLAVLADIDGQGLETILNLGDHLSGPLAAGETADILLGREMISLRGNHDRYLIEQAPEEMGPSDRVAYGQLSPAHLEWLGALPVLHEISGEILMCHGTPESDEMYWLERVLPTGEVAFRDHGGIEAFGAGQDFPLILCAHTHTPRAVRLGDGRLVVNPGSVGLPAYDDTEPVYHIMQTGAPDARYAVVEKVGGDWKVCFKSVPYDATRMAALAREAGRDDWANAVATGWFAGT